MDRKELYDAVKGIMRWSIYIDIILLVLVIVFSILSMWDRDYYALVLGLIALVVGLTALAYCFIGFNVVVPASMVIVVLAVLMAMTVQYTSRFYTVSHLMTLTGLVLSLLAFIKMVGDISVE